MKPSSPYIKPNRWTIERGVIGALTVEPAPFLRRLALAQADSPRTASAHCRSDSPSMNCMTVIGASRHGCAAG